MNHLRRSVRWRFAAAVLAVVVGVAGTVGLAVLLVWQALDPAARASLVEAVRGQLTGLVLVALAHVAAVVWMLRLPLRRYVRPARRLADEVTAIAASRNGRRVELPPETAPELREAADAVEALAEGFGRLRATGERIAPVRGAWPLHEVDGAELTTGFADALRAAWGVEVAARRPPVAPALLVDEGALRGVVDDLAALAAAHGRPAGGQVRLGVTGALATLDLSWEGEVPALEELRGWERQAGARGLSPKDVAARHLGELASASDPVGGRARLRLVLALGSATAQRPRSRPPATPGSRAVASTSRDEPVPAADAPLSSLRYVVLDTETTGLDPERDAVVAVGAVHVVGGHVEADGPFSALVDPARPVSRASVQVHGLDNDLLDGRPRLEQVLPALARFCAGAVLVGHSLSFDLRILERAGGAAVLPAATLDTLDLAALALPSQQDLSLDALARRFGTQVIGRHTALGDARTTAEVLVHLLAVLERRGVATWGELQAALVR